MYTVTMNGKEYKIDAKGVEIEQGTILFYSNKECTECRTIVHSGKWDRLTVEDSSTSLIVQRRQEEPRHAVEMDEEDSAVIDEE